MEVSVVDSSGALVYSANNAIHFELTGKGRIIGLDSGDIRSHESFKASERIAYQGRGLVLIQSTSQAGTIQLKATASGLLEDKITVTVSPAKR